MPVSRVSHAQISSGTTTGTAPIWTMARTSDREAQQPAAGTFGDDERDADQQRLDDARRR